VRETEIESQSQSRDAYAGAVEYVRIAAHVVHGRVYVQHLKRTRAFAVWANRENSKTKVMPGRQVAGRC
jgi:hypothetical protein